MWMTAFLRGLAVYLVSHDNERQQSTVSLKASYKAEDDERECFLLWRNGTASQMLQVVAATSCKRVYSSLKLSSHLRKHKAIY